MEHANAIATAALIVHSLSAVVWVGGMFFAYMVLRPSAGTLDAAARLALWAGVFERFFRWVIATIVLLLASGYAMVIWVFGGFAWLGVHVDVMQATGIVMMLLFFHLYFAPWKRYRRAFAAGNLPEAGRQLGQIRIIVAVNLVLGLVTVAVASSGRYWG
ncbi:MAG TPA: CopD family protein [Stellaceae bacterium]|nr:CopD family protein [Stellaceae bacterium]